MQFLNQNTLTKKQIEQILKKSKNINLAVAFWGQGASNSIKKVKNKKIKIICNLESGATNPYEIIKIGKLVGFDKIRSIKNLHAKVYLTEKEMILGSSNFSANGLSLEGNEINKLIEANVSLDDKNVIFQANNWFSDLWSQSKKINQRYCEEFISKWAKNRNRSRTKKVVTDFFGAYEEGLYNEDEIYIIIDTGGFTLAEEKIGDKLAKESVKNDLLYEGKEISYWYGYEDIPRDALIINYFYEKNGRLDCYGVWKTLPKKYDREGWQFCYEADSELIDNKHINQITRILKQNIKKLQIGEDGLEMKLSMFYKKFNPSR